MRTIHDYMMLASDRHGYTSRRQLSNALGLNASTVMYWDRQQSWPNDEDMIRLADLVGIDRLEALNDRDHWRAAGQAKSCYRQIGQILARGAATTVVLLGITASAWAGTGPAQGNLAEAETGYYGKSWVSLLIAALRRICWPGKPEFEPPRRPVFAAVFSLA